MPSQFEYSGVDTSGRPVRGQSEGTSPLDLVLQLKNSGITVYSIKRKFLPGSEAFSSQKISLSQLALFNEQLAGLLKTSLPLGESVRHLSSEMRNLRMKQVLEDIGREVERGKSLSECLAEHEDYLPPIYGSMVRAGEKIGNLTDSLHLVAEYFKATDNIKRKILNILLYPLILNTFAVIVLLFLIKVMAPPYIEMYSTFGVKLPFIVKVLAQVERILHPISAIIAALVLAAGAVFMISWLRETRNREVLGRFFLRIPVWGELVKQGLLSHNFSTIALLLRSGVPLTESLNVVKDITPNTALRDAFASAAQDVSEGKTLSENIVKQSVVPLEAAWIIRNGEMNGNLIKAMESAASLCESKFDFSSRLILSVLEPLLLFAVGAVVVSIAIALFYPLYSISSHMGI